MQNPPIIDDVTLQRKLQFLEQFADLMPETAEFFGIRSVIKDARAGNWKDVVISLPWIANDLLPDMKLFSDVVDVADEREMTEVDHVLMYAVDHAKLPGFVRMRSHYCDSNVALNDS